MTPALKLFEHLADFSDEQRTASEPFEQEFVPLIAPGPQQPETDLGDFDPFAQTDATEESDDPFALESGLNPWEGDPQSLPLDSGPVELDALTPLAGDDPIELDPELPIADIGSDEPGLDPFGPEPAGQMPELDPFDAGAESPGADTLLPEADPLNPADDPFGLPDKPDAIESEPQLADLEPGLSPDGPELPQELPSLPEEDPVDPLMRQDGVPADDPVLAEAMDTFGEPQSEDIPQSVAVETESPPLDIAETDSTDVGARSAEALHLQEEAESRIAGNFAAALSGAEEKLTELVCGSVAGVLAGIVNDELVRRSIEALAGRLQGIAGAGGALRIDVKGPVSLFEKLKAALGEDVPEFRYTEDDTPDLTIEVDSQIVSSRIGEWRQSVEGCLS